MPDVNALLNKIKQSPEQIDFSEVIAHIDANYQYQPCAFTNGELNNVAGSNEGSCKIFSFAKLQELDHHQTLALFGQFYRTDVLGNPEGNDHGNIRNFIKHGWDGIKFAGVALS